MPTVQIAAHLTDAGWKKDEKKIKLSGTGIGKTLRDVEKAVTALNVEIKGGMDQGKLDTLLGTLKTALTASATKINKNEKKLKKKSPPQQHLYWMAWYLDAAKKEIEGNWDAKKDFDRTTDRISLRLNDSKHPGMVK